MTFTRDDVKRVLWTFIFTAVSIAIVQFTDIMAGTVSWKTVVVAAVAAGLSAVKNLLTETGSAWK